MQNVLRRLGKTRGKVTVVFAADTASAEPQIRYLRANLELPVWLFSCTQPSPDVAAQCARIIVEASALRLWLRAQRELWPFQVALAVADWNGTSGNWLVKLAPLTVPFFRALFRNQSGEFFSGTPRLVWLHANLALQRQFRDLRVRSGELALGSLLWLFAFIGQWCSPLSRAVFRRVRGTETLDLSITGTGEGILRYRYSGRTWDAHAIAEALRHSEARYLFFQRDDDSSNADDLLACIRNIDSFVVSRQYAVRGWRKLLFATAPFRALAAGECVQVHAPVSPAMLVDIAKLRALNLPALSSFGSNWYTLFHQAAAAGWQSYSVGQTALPTELAAVPFEEAEFVRNLLDRPELHKLAPRNPALARGNIARSVQPGPPFRNLPRVLVVSPYLPFPLSHGGAVRIWNLCRALSDRVDFVLACFREKQDSVQYGKLHEVFREVYVVDIDEKHRSPALPTQVNGYESSTMRALIATICRTQPIALLQVEYTQMAAYREAAPAVPAILVEHDLTFSLFAQLKHPEYALWLKFERERLQAFDGVWTMSDLDRAGAIAEGSAPDRTFVIANGVDLQRFRCTAADSGAQQVLYVGSFRHLPNYLAFEELRGRIMPAVWEQFPKATLTVVAGPKHIDHWPGSREVDRRITVHGFVEDLLPIYAGSSVVAIPLPVSAGTNIKLMEALSCERPVVTTPVGCAGLELKDGRDVLIRDLGSPFSSAVCELLGDPDYRNSLAAAGLQQAQERFNWDAIADQAYESYSTIIPSFPLWRPKPRLRFQQA